MATYAAQHRGDPEAYRRYLAAMDASMRQKVALTAAHLLTHGKAADMGMGSGTGTYALAALYPALEVVGVDVNPTMVELAARTHQLPNLGFQVGDIAEPCFPPGSLDAIFDSSVLHHVTSFNGFRYQEAERALRAQKDQLRMHGTLIVRDFLAPPSGPVWLDLKPEDAELLRRFAREFRGGQGFAIAEIEPGRFELDRRHAAEFVLRKDYRENWDVEVLEEYCYYTQEEFEAVFARLGLRVLASNPLRNPWIVRHRFRGKFELRTANGEIEDDLPTNYVIVGERVPEREGVRFAEADPIPPLGFLKLEHYRDTRTGQVLDLVRRPNLTVDVIPWFEHGGMIYVVARRSYPRPILACDRRGSPLLDGGRPPGYVTEPISAMQTDRPLGMTVEETLKACGIPRFRRAWPGASYYPSPGGVLEEVRSLWVEIDPCWDLLEPANRWGWSTAGRVRAIEAGQLLRAGQVGGLPDARLELNVHALLRRLGRPPEPWIGETVELPEGPRPPRWAVSERRVFERCEERADFLQVACARFDELASDGRVLASNVLEFVLPRPFSWNTLAVAMLLRHGGEVYLGVFDDDRPAAQGISGNSNLLSAPAWRLPRAVSTLRGSRAWVRQRLLSEYEVECGELYELGGRYHPSPGTTPEVVFPLAGQALTPGKLLWLPLSEVLGEVPDGHLRLLSERAALATTTLPAGGASS